jgi:hypothetical protein
MLAHGYLTTEVNAVDDDAQGRRFNDGSIIDGHLILKPGMLAQREVKLHSTVRTSKSRFA